MALPNLISHPDTTDMTAAKVWREVRSNSKDRLLANNQDSSLNVDTTAGGTIVLTVNQREPVQLIRLTGSPGGAYTIQFADGNKQFEIENVSGQSATIDSTTGAASPPVVATGATALIHLHGTELTVLGVVALQLGALLHSGQIDPTGGFDFADNEIKRAHLIDHAFEVTSPSSSSGVLTLDMENGNYFDVTFTEDVTTLNLDNPPVTADVGNIFLIARQNGVGGWTITWPGSVLWEQFTGTSPDRTLSANAVDIYWFFTLDNGTTWYGHVIGLDMG